MRKFLLMILLAVLMITVYKAINTPDYVRINKDMVRACSVDMANGAICD